MSLKSTVKTKIIEQITTTSFMLCEKTVTILMRLNNGQPVSEKSIKTLCNIIDELLTLKEDLKP